MPHPDLARFFYQDGQTEWPIRGPHHPDPEHRCDYVEVTRHRRPDGIVIYRKRFLKRPDRRDLGYWTERELQFINHFQTQKTPHVVRLAAQHIDPQQRPESLDTYELGFSLDRWHTLEVSPPGSTRHPAPLFSESGEIAKLLCACLRALHAPHEQGILHGDIKLDNFVMPHCGQPRDAAGLRLDYGQLSLIDFAFSLRPHNRDFALRQALPMNPAAAEADYFSPFFKQALHADRGKSEPTAWQRLNYSIDLFALAVMLQKLLAWQKAWKPTAAPDALTAFLEKLAADWQTHYADGQIPACLPHLAEIQRIQAQRRDWEAEDWRYSARFVPCRVMRRPTAAPTVLVPEEDMHAPPGTPLDDGYDSPASGGDSSPGPRQPPKPRWLAAGWAGVVLMATGIYFEACAFIPPPPAPPLGEPSKPLFPAPSACAAPVALVALGSSDALTSPPRALAASPDGTYLAAGGQDGGLWIWSGTDLNKPKRLRNPDGKGLKALAFSPDGAWLVAGGSHKTVRRFDTASGLPVGPDMAGHGDTVIDLAFDPKGREVASFASDGGLYRWNIDSGTAAAEFKPPVPMLINAASYGPVPGLFATGTRGGWVGLWRWNPATHQAESVGEPSQGHAGPVDALAFSPDGSLLISGGWDKTLRRWEVATGWVLSPELGL